MSSLVRLPLLLALATLAVACKRDEPPPPPAPAPREPIDRLAPGELQPGSESAFGLVLPRGIKVKSRTARRVLAEGDLSPERVANYVRTRVVVKHVELGAAKTVFPAMRIKGGDPDQVIRLEVINLQGKTRLMFKDITLRPSPPEPMTDEERWRRAGHAPDGDAAHPME